MCEELNELKAFARIWNAARTYPTNYTLERAFGISISEIREKADTYSEKHSQHPSLPELIWRRGETGQAIPVPAYALKQLDPFRIDRKLLQKAKGVVVTSAQYGANIHQDFWKTLKNYAAHRGFVLVVMPIKYGPVQFINGHYTSTFPDELKGHVVFEDVMLGDGKIQLNVTRMRPTLGRFLTSRVCQMGGLISQVFAAPAFELEHRARIGHDYPKACMTTGAVSLPEYAMDKLGQQDRTGEIATENHTLGALVIEFEPKQFHFRQLQANKAGEFYDIDPQHGGARFYTAECDIHCEDAVEGLVLGDWHTGTTCPNVRKTTFGPGGITDVLRPRNIVLHDFVDGNSVSHWEQHQAHRRAWKAPLQYDSLEIELKEAVKELDWIHSRTPDIKKHVVASNHPEFITRYIEDMRWVKDDANLACGAKLFTSMITDLEERKPTKAQASATDPVVLYFRKHCAYANHLTRKNELFIAGVLCSMHGDVGPQGIPSRSTDVFAKWGEKIVLGHNHSGVIMGQVWRAGTSTPNMKHYVNNPTTHWTNTHCVIFENGQRMLINIVNKRWHSYKKSA